jgi:hypothetical protein
VAPRARAMPLRLSRPCGRERCRYGRVCRDQFDISRLNIAHGCPLLGLTALRGEHPHTLPSRAGTAAPSQRLASLATEPAMGRPPKARACGARDCSEWNPAGRGRRSLWRRGLERCRYGRPDAAGSSDAATAVPAPSTPAIPIQPRAPSELGRGGGCELHCSKQTE